MSNKESRARIKINRLLEESGWHFFDNDIGRANIVLENNTRVTTKSIDEAGENFEKTRGYIVLKRLRSIIFRCKVI